VSICACACASLPECVSVCQSIYMSVCTLSVWWVCISHQGQEGVVDEERVVALVKVTLATGEDLQTRIERTLPQHLSVQEGGKVD
jgi:hypothetical protein